MKTASPAALLLALSALSLAGCLGTHHRTGTGTQGIAPALPAPAAIEGPRLPPGVPAAAGKVETAFALRYVDVKPGEGALAAEGQFLTVQYTGWLGSDGTKFDSSLDRSEPFTFRLGLDPVIQGWIHGFEGMRAGGKRRLYIPYQLAYGERGRPPVIPPKSDLIFDIELVAAGDTPPAPPQPPADSQPSDQPAPPSQQSPPSGQQATPPQPQ